MRQAAIDGNLAGGHEAAVRRREKGSRRPDLRWIAHALERMGVAYCVMSGAQLPCLLRATAPFVYVRLHGPDEHHLYGGSYSEEERPSTLDVETSGGAGPTVRDEDEAYKDSPVSPVADLGGEASAPEVQVSSEPSLAGESAPTVENVADDEAEDASSNE